MISNVNDKNQQNKFWVIVKTIKKLFFSFTSARDLKNEIALEKLGRRTCGNIGIV